MTSRRQPRLADAAEIAAEQGLTPARITGLYTERAENAAGETFPEPVDKRGRARLWDHAAVTKWFAHRARARLAEHTPPSRDPEELLNAAAASRYLGYKNSNQVSTFVRDHPGYFPEPDVAEEKGTAENPYRRRLWKVATLQLLGASQAAALLGYKSLGSFSSSLSQGNLPLLETTDGAAKEGRQKGRRRWTRRRILEQAAQRSKK